MVVIRSNSYLLGGKTEYLSKAPMTICLKFFVLISVKTTGIT